MNEEFQKEARYTVLKYKDIEFGLRKGFVSPDELLAFNEFCKKVALARDFRKAPGATPPPKDELTTVVIESSWQCYQTAWDLVEAEHYSSRSQQ